MQLSLSAARALMLAAMGLSQPPSSPASKDTVLETIRRMGVLQIDTIHVVARSPYLVLWSRLGTYEPRWLDELLAERQIFEYWAHVACFLPAEMYPIYRSHILEGNARGWKYAQDWMGANRALVDAILERVRVHGEVRSSDFERTDGEKGTWWNWKIEKQALEMLFMAGDLMIARRHNFQRIYDLRERVRPDWDDALAPAPEEARRTLVLKAVQALGITSARWVADYFRTGLTGTTPLVERLAADGQLLTVEVEGWPEPAYIHPDHVELVARAASGQLAPTYTTLLSPFDPLVWDRARALAMFGFDYRIECYTPAPKRRYGYFTLPILRRGELVGRLDPKAHREEGIFEVKALHLEPGIAADQALADDIAAALQSCARWHQTPSVVVGWCDPKPFGALLRRALKANPRARN
jgi:uncharacterized protein YcaQ